MLAKKEEIKGFIGIEECVDKERNIKCLWLQKAGSMRMVVEGC